MSKRPSRKIKAELFDVHKPCNVVCESARLFDSLVRSAVALIFLIDNVSDWLHLTPTLAFDPRAGTAWPGRQGSRDIQLTNFISTPKEPANHPLRSHHMPPRER